MFHSNFAIVVFANLWITPYTTGYHLHQTKSEFHKTSIKNKYLPLYLPTDTISMIIKEPHSVLESSRIFTKITMQIVGNHFFLI